MADPERPPTLTRGRRTGTPTVPGTPVAANPPLTYEDRFSRLLDVASEEAPDAPEIRPVIVLGEDDMETFRRWADAKYVANIYGDVTKAGNEEISEACLKAWIEALWQYKVRPNNPELKDIDKATGAVTVETVFVVKEDCKFILPKSKEEFKSLLTKELAKRFEATGIMEADARKDAETIVGECINLRPTLGAIDLNPDPDEKRAVTDAKFKLLDLLEWDGTDETKPVPLSDAEKKLLFTKKLVPSVRDDFFTRVVNIVRSKDQLYKVFEVIQPATSITAPKYGESAKSKARLERLIGDARKAIENKAAE